MTHNQIAARYRELLTKVLELDSEGEINSRWYPPIYKLADTYSRGMSHITARGMDASILEDIADHIEDIEDGG